MPGLVKNGLSQIPPPILESPPMPEVPDPINEALEIEERKNLTSQHTQIKE